VLIDDFSQFGTNVPATALAAHPKIELRLFNPFAYRGTVRLIRDAEMIVDAGRLNYRMHNKVFIVDNAMAIVGGRNIGDEYFQAATAYEFGDFDVVAVGPAVQQVSASFDAFWNSPLSIPVQALEGGRARASDLEQLRATLAAHRETVASAPQVTKLALGEPFSSLLAGRTPFVWARGEVMYDSPEKAKTASGEQPGRLLHKQLRTVASDVRSELVVVSPYLVPGENGMRYFGKLREKDVKVRLLTNSLACTDMPIAHSGYRPYRIPMLEMGVELYEVKPQLGQPEVRGGSLKSPSSGQYALHAKVFVFDRRQVFIGSMNLDPRSLHLNTEIGVLIDSPELARQVIARFDDIAQPPNSYVMMLDKADPIRGPALVWRTEERGASIDYRDEPDTTFWLKTKVDMLSLLTLEDLL
jgi:putative cardiolipin synthase